MKKIILIIVIVTYSIISFSQNVYFTKKATVDFFSSTPIEDIKAKSNDAISILKTENKEISFGVTIKSFTFENSLMQEHFNENYMESDKFPSAKFKGTISDVTNVNFKEDGTYPVKLLGTITIHGVKKDIEPKAVFIIKDGKISAKSIIKLKPNDFNIEIPSIVNDKIAKELSVTINANYEPYVKK